MKRLFVLIFSLVSWCAFMPYAAALCRQSNATNVGDTASAQIPFGRINLTDTYLQPVGSLLASTDVPPTAFTAGGANAGTVLWECDESDLSSLYFLVATNGDDRVGGYWDIGAIDGLPDVYATWFPYVGLRLSMGGVAVTRYWKKVPLTSYDRSGGRVRIRVQDIPTLRAELYRVSSIPAASGAVTNHCSNMAVASGTGTVYTCAQPNAYIQLHGFGLIDDEAGTDSSWNFRFWVARNGIGYGLRDAVSLSNNATCVARTATPLVLLPTISTARLSAGQVARNRFSVQLECSNAASSGVGGGQTAIGIQVSASAYGHAQRLGLLNAAGGVEALVSDNYGKSGYAGGVGIHLEEASSGTPIPFVGQPGLTGNVPVQHPSGRSAGWWPVTEGATPTGSSAAGYQNYQRNYDAVLKVLRGQQPTPGRVEATAYVLVKVQ